jgi:hypothetical protein
MSSRRTSIIFASCALLIGLAAWRLTHDDARRPSPPAAFEANVEAASRPTQVDRSKPSAVPRTAFVDAGDGAEPVEAAASRAAGDGRITGRVLDVEGSPLAGVDVVLHATRVVRTVAQYDFVPFMESFLGATPPFGAARTDAAGAYVFDAPPAGEWIAVASTPGRRTVAAEPVRKRKGVDVRVADLSLPPGRRLAGVVRDASGPLVDVRVAWSPTGEMPYPIPPLGERRTDFEGRFVFEDYPDGPTILVARSDGRPTILHPLPAAASGPVTLTMIPSATIRGRTLDRTTGNPVAGVRLCVSRFPDEASVAVAVSDAEGRYELSPAPSGKDLTIAVRKHGYTLVASPEEASGARPISGEGMQALDVVAPGAVVERDLLLAGAAPVHGRVVNAADGAGIGGAVVHLRSTAHGAVRQETATTDDSGAFEIRAAAAGGVAVVAEKAGWHAEPSKAESAAAGPFPTTIVTPGVRGEAIVVKLRRGLDVKGLVVDESGRPVAQADIVWRAEASPAFAGASAFYDDTYRGTTVSDGEGAFTVQGLPARTIAVGVRHSDFPAGGAVRRDFAADPATPIRLVLSKGGSFAGRLVYPDGRPATAVPLNWRADDRLARAIKGPFENVEPRAISDDAGRFRFDGLPLGAGRLDLHWSAAERWRSADGEGVGSDAPRHFFIDPLDAAQEIVRESRPERTVRLIESLAIAGHVVDDAGDTVQGALMKAESDDRSAAAAYAVTDESGAFRLTPLPPGRFTVTAEHESAPNPKPVRRRGAANQIDAGATALRVVIR